MRDRSIQLLGEVDVASQRDGDPVRRTARQRFIRFHLADDIDPPPLERFCFLDFGNRGAQDDAPAAAVDDHLDLVLYLPHTLDSHDTGNSQAVSQDRRMGGPGSFYTDETGDVLTGKLDGQPRGELSGQHHDRSIPLSLSDILHRLPEQLLEHPNRNPVEICPPLAEHCVTRLRPLSTELESAIFESAFSTQLVRADQLLDRRHEIGVSQHQQLGVEDSGLGRSRPFLGAAT